MKQLVLIRHAKSSWKDPARPDFDRPLSSRGKKDAPEMGRRLAQRAVRLDALVTSPARRAKTTALHIAEALDISEGEVLEHAAIYRASARDLIGVIHGLDDRWDVVALVGHNPGFSDLADQVSDFGAETMATCGIAMIEFKVASWSLVAEKGGTVAFYDYPKKPPARGV